MNNLVVLGTRPGSPGMDNPSSGYLIETAKSRILIDCGAGIALTLASLDLLDSLDAIVVTHRHPDHSCDLVPLAMGRLFPRAKEPIAVFGPEDVGLLMKGLDALYGIPTLEKLASPLQSAFNFQSVEGGESRLIGSLRMEFHTTTHSVPTVAIRIPELGFVYTSDAGLNDRLIEFCRGATTILTESTYRSGNDVARLHHGHMDARDVAELGSASQASHLLLTHIVEESQREDCMRIVRDYFPGNVAIAMPGERVPLFKRD